MKPSGSASRKKARSSAVSSAPAQPKIAALGALMRHSFPPPSYGGGGPQGRRGEAAVEASAISDHDHSHSGISSGASAPPPRVRPPPPPHGRPRSATAGVAP